MLVIEDTPANLQLVTYLLESSGHTVLGSDDAETGLELARTCRPHLIVLDIQLPGMDGYAALAAIRADAALAGTPVVAVTAFAMVGDQDRAEQAGFDGFLIKPIDPYTFVADIGAYLPATLR